MRVEESIVALCDRWWTELSHSDTATIRNVAEGWMDYLGWKAGEPVVLEGAACGYTALNQSGQRIVFYFTMPGELDTPSAVVKKGLDYCETTLLLVGEAQLSKFDYVVITDLNRCYVYDAATDELILSSDTPQLFVGTIMESLLKEEVDGGSLDAVRREPSSYIARQLRTWCERWVVILSREPYGNEGIANAIVDRILVLRFLYDHSICETASWSYKARFTNVIGSAYEESPLAAKRNLVRLMDDMDAVWQCDLYARDESITRIVSKSENVVSMIQELALMAKTKFSVSAIMESFNYGDASEKARVRLVPEPSEERELWLGKMSISNFGESKMEVDVLEEGYRAIPYWFNRLLQTLRRVSVENDLTRWAEDCFVEAPAFEESGEMDLFAWSNENESAEGKNDGSEIDLLGLALRKLFYIWTATDRQRRTARIILFLHVIEFYESRGYSFGRFPVTEFTFGKRPALLEADKQWIYQGRSDSATEWDVI